MSVLAGIDLERASAVVLEVLLWDTICAQHERPVDQAPRERERELIRRLAGLRGQAHAQHVAERARAAQGHQPR